MKNTQIIPTDKDGNVYYGPTTFSGAEEQIIAGRPAAETANMMEAAGYVGVARRIRKEYGVEK